MIGSHCIGLELIIERLQAEGLAVKVINVGSTSGLAAAERDECDVAPVHLMDPATSEYNKPFLTARMELVPGYRRLQGIVFRLPPAIAPEAGLSLPPRSLAAQFPAECRG